MLGTYVQVLYMTEVLVLGTDEVLYRHKVDMYSVVLKQGHVIFHDEIKIAIL